jgi:spore coat protein U-like protein
MIPRPARRLAAALATVLFLAGPAQAACTIGATPLAFGPYNALSPLPTDATGQVTISCTGLLALSVSVRLDKGGAPSFDPRQMTKGGEILRYNLYTDATRLSIFGDGTAGTQFYSSLIVVALFGTPIPVPIFGRIPAGQAVSIGTYTNSVTATVSF